MIDATGGSDTNFAAPGVYLFAVKAASIDLGVAALQLEVSYLQNGDPNFPTKRAVTVLKASSGVFSYVFILPPVYDATGVITAAPSIASITIRELKPASSQSF